MEDETEGQTTPTSVGTGVARFADPAMFQAAPMAEREGGGYGAAVHLLWMTPDPLGAIAAMCRMYEGKPTYNLSDITNTERHRYWNDALNTHLKAPLEAVKFHFFLESVDRSFTHQMVRQRTAVFAQESLRFAVKAGLATEAIKPPTIVNGSEDVQLEWEVALANIQGSYDRLIDLGIPAEDARGLLPHCVATRLNYVTDLRALADHAGNRLCTQAQFHWRYAFAGIVNSIRQFGGDHSVQFGDEWQFVTLADSMMFRPVCYQLGKCPFKATFDRACSIRGRVDDFGRYGIAPSEWGEKQYLGDTKIYLEPIQDAEWLLNPESAR